MTSDQLNRLVDWVEPNLKSSMPKPEIRRIYLELVKYIDEEIMARSIFGPRWKLLRGLAS
jgi:hypothetical protein